MTRVYFKCETCDHFNHSEMGTPEFEFRQVSFDTFSDAWNHMMTWHGQHHMDIIVEDEESNG